MNQYFKRPWQETFTSLRADSAAVSHQTRQLLILMQNIYSSACAIWFFKIEVKIRHFWTKVLLHCNLILFGISSFRQSKFY